jgi:hypothetical protein
MPEQFTENPKALDEYRQQLREEYLKKRAVSREIKTFK